MQGYNPVNSKFHIFRALSEPVKVALIIGVSLLIGAYLNGGRYTLSSAISGPGVFVLDRWTGTLQWCNVGDCRNVQQKS